MINLRKIFLTSWTLLTVVIQMVSVERSIHAYELNIKNLSFNDIIKLLSGLNTQRQKDPSKLLLAVSNVSYLYLAQHGTGSYSTKGHSIPSIWLKFGWARETGLPETLDVSNGSTQYLNLPSGTYLFEPAHFLLFEFSGRVYALHEYNFYAPRIGKLCEYLTNFWLSFGGNSDIEIKAHRLFVSNIHNMLWGYDTVKRVYVELEASLMSSVFARNPPRTLLGSLFRSNPKRLGFSFKSSKGGELDISINDLWEVFEEIFDYTKSFVVYVRKGRVGKPLKIDLKKQAIIFKKEFELAQDKNGNVYRSTDTVNAVDTLKSVISDVISQLDSS